MNLSKNTKIVLAKAGQTSAGTQVDTDIIDMQGYEGIIFLGSITTVNAGNYAKAQQGDASNMSDAADLEGTKVVPGHNGDSYLIDIYKPKKRYLRVNIIRAGANTATGDVYAILYGAHKMPVTHGTTIDAELNISPAEGTA